MITLFCIRMMFGYNVAKNKDTDRFVLVTLEIPSDALTNMNRTNILVKQTAMYRANKAVVIKIEDVEGACYKTASSYHYNDTPLLYKVGEIIEELSYDTNIENVCTKGIHYYLSRHVAESYLWDELQNRKVNDYIKQENGEVCSYLATTIWKPNGSYQRWYPNGQPWESTVFLDGEYHGRYQKWYPDGQIWEDVTYSNGIKHGRFQKWYQNGQKWEEVYYINGKEDGLYESWYDNGNKMWRIPFRNGKINGIQMRWYYNSEKHFQVVYEDGICNGITMVWDSNGKRELAEIYINGKYCYSLSD